MFTKLSLYVCTELYVLMFEYALYFFCYCMQADVMGCVCLSWIKKLLAYLLAKNAQDQ